MATSPDGLNLQGVSADALKLLFEKAYDAYQADNERFWKMVNFVSLINGGLLVLLAYAKEPAFWLVAAVVGVILCGAWYGMQNRYAWWCGWWDARLGELEDAYLKATGATETVSGPFMHHRSPKESPGGWSTRRTARVIPLAFGAAWIGVLIIAIPRML